MLTAINKCIKLANWTIVQIIMEAKQLIMTAKKQSNNTTMLECPATCLTTTVLYINISTRRNILYRITGIQVSEASQPTIFLGFSLALQRHQYKVYNKWNKKLIQVYFTIFKCNLVVVQRRKRSTHRPCLPILEEES